MPKNTISIKIGGEAGQGVESGGAGFARALVRGGLWVFGLQDYMSRIRGGHNFYHVRVSEQPIYSHVEDVHLLLAFNKDAVGYHLEEIVPGGGVIHDEAVKVDEAALAAGDVRNFELPLVKLAEEIGGHRIMMNTAALGATAGLTGYNFERIEDVIENNFKRKGADVIASNIRVAKAAYDMAGDRYGADFPWKLEAIPNQSKKMLVNGNQAIGMGAIAAGCKFISTYPMTPASTITEYIAANARKFGIVQKETEDELSAILFAIGAAHAGVRAMTASSGGGFCLMVEAYGLAAMTETPLVIAEVQRGGPSTGLPTRTESSDLQFVLHASHGEFPRIVTTPGTVEQCFESGYRAFNLAEKYQTPVIILTDLFLSNQVRTVPVDSFDFKQVQIDRGSLVSNDELDKLTSPYARHLVTDSGISPRAFPGHEKAVYITTGDEHSERGWITEDADVRIVQMEKRMRKEALAAREDMRLPQVWGPETADISIVTWGSTIGAAEEAARMLTADGLTTNVLQFVDMHPIDEDKLTEIITGLRKMVVIEMNFTGQLAQVIRQYTGRKPDVLITKYDGRPFSPEEIVRGVREKVVVNV
ncbi:MAG: 2-oxoacid:acceptor oxidoreductase subunit alpha [Chloroflexota bacterium]